MGNTKIPKVSIVVPTYNGSKFILRTLNSILSQSYKNYEIIVIDDASTDGTGKIIKKIPNKRIRYFRNSRNKGTSKARNRGLTLARGRYIAYCDHDDIWYKNHLKEIVSVLDQNPDVGLVFAKYRIVGTRKGQHLNYNYIYPKGHFSQEVLEAENIIGCPLNVVHRKECIKKAGFFNENKTITGHGYEDWDLWLRISDFFKLHHLDMVLAKYFFHGENRSGLTDSFIAYIHIVKKRIKKYKSNNRLGHYALSVIFCLSVQLINNKNCIGRWVEIKNQLLDFREKKWRDLLCTYCKGIDLYIRGNFSMALLIFRRTFIYFSNNKSFNKNRNTTRPLSYLLARCEEGLRNFAKAIQLHEEIIKIDKDYLLSRERLPLLYFRLKKYKKALRLAKDFPSGVTYNMQGIYFMEKKHYREAISFFKKALYIEPQFTPPRKNLKIAQKLLCITETPNFPPTV